MTISYARARDDEQLRRLKPAIKRFIERCKHPPAANSPCAPQTVFFFPGAMASRLVRAQNAYQEGVGVPAGTGYDVAWADWLTLLGGWRNLKLFQDADGCFRDTDNRFVIADGALEVEGVSPHMLFESWCAGNKANLFVFGWDWRRRLDETVDFFLGRFLPYLRHKVMQAGCPDPLANYSIVGHSFGGLVVNLILRGGHPLTANLKKAVTVGAPQYGFPGALHLWFEGLPWLTAAEVETLEGLGLTFLAEAVKFDMLEVIASMPALYTLPPLDVMTYNNVQGMLAADPNCPLAAYPSKDALVPVVDADAYNPTSLGFLVRYPGNTGFSYDELYRARTQTQLMSSAMSPAQSARYYNIRGVTTKTGGAPDLNTVGSVKCGWISPVYWPSVACPIADDDPLVPGDDTQPGWTARLATNAAAHCKTVQGHWLNHACLMNDADVVKEIARILCAGSSNQQQLFALKAKQRRQIAPATEKEVKEFLRWVWSERRRKEWPRLDERGAREFLPTQFRDRFDAIVVRLFRDWMRGQVVPRKKSDGGESKGSKPGGRKARSRQVRKKRASKKP